jgi:hypothetical protein
MCPRYVSRILLHCPEDQLAPLKPLHPLEPLIGAIYAYEPDHIQGVQLLHITSIAIAGQQLVSHRCCAAAAVIWSASAESAHGPNNKAFSEPTPQHQVPPKYISSQTNHGATLASSFLLTSDAQTCT